mmetsp:Transcript_17267/g.49031  ORF Transcript_17267/g.49031 Transcript_17267/m.49031 type:complete len:201 (-) Transcript_17267:536-1138(-)
MIYAVAAAICLATAASSASPTGTPLSFLIRHPPCTSSFANRGNGITCKPREGRLPTADPVRVVRHPLTMVTRAIPALGKDGWFDAMMVAAGRMAGKKSPPPSDDELRQWVTDGENMFLALLDDENRLKKKGLPKERLSSAGVSREEAEVFLREDLPALKRGMANLYLMAAELAEKRGLGLVYNPAAISYAWAATLPVTRD